MNIASHISELLRMHDTVAIPQFGEFYGKYDSAKINPVTCTLSPPSKEINFNFHPAPDDGLLKNFIAKQENISLESAAEKIMEFVSFCKNSLEEKGTLLIPAIGKFIFDIER